MKSTNQILNIPRLDRGPSDVLCASLLPETCLPVYSLSEVQFAIFISGTINAALGHGSRDTDASRQAKVGRIVLEAEVQAAEVVDLGVVLTELLIARRDVQAHVSRGAVGDEALVHAGHVVDVGVVLAVGGVAVDESQAVSARGLLGRRTGRHGGRAGVGSSGQEGDTGNQDNTGQGEIQAGHGDGVRIEVMLN